MPLPEHESEWTPMEIDTLKSALAEGLSVNEAAEVLERRLDDVAQKCRELELRLPSRNSAE
jgi:hypothetical protein